METNKPKTQRKAPTTDNYYGKVPPQDLKIEETILGALLVEHVDELKWAALKPEMFYKDSHAKIFDAISVLRKEKTNIDLRTVTAKLREHGDLQSIGGMFALTELTNGVTSTANIEYHARILHQLFLKRELIRISHECSASMYDDTEDPLSAIKAIVTQVKDLERGLFKRQEKTASQLANEALTEINKEKKDGLLGNSTGMRGLDFVIQGKQKGHLIIIPAATSMGKSLLMCSLAKNCSFDNKNELHEKQKGCAIFSLEMKSVELSFRLLGNISDVPVKKIQLNQLDDTERLRVIEANEKYAKSKIIIDDTPGITITELEIKIITLVAVYGIEEVYIDYFQLVRFDKSLKNINREEGLSDISRRLKTLAGELGITIILFSQVSDDVKTRYLRIPTGDDIKYCKGAANDADIIMPFWRPGYYPEVLEEIKTKTAGIQCTLFNVNVTDFDDVGFLIVQKYRNGDLGKIPVRVKFDIMRVSDYPPLIDSLNGRNPQVIPQQQTANF